MYTETKDYRSITLYKLSNAMIDWIKNTLIIVALAGLLMIPVWIRGIYIRPWPTATKEILIAVLTLVGLGFSIWIISRPTADHSIINVWGPDAGAVIYAITVLLYAYLSWPRR